MHLIHSLNVWFAREYGVSAALVFHEIYLNCRENKSCGRCSLKGSGEKKRVWCAFSFKDLTETMVYMAGSTIKRAVKKLKDEGLIEVGKLDGDLFDKTNWYCITDRGMEIYNKLSRNAGTESVNESNVENELGFEGVMEKIDFSRMEVVPEESVKKAKVMKKHPVKKTYNVELYNECVKIIDENRSLLRSMGKQVDETSYPIGIYRGYLKRLFNSYGVDRTKNGLKASVKFDWLVNTANYSITALMSGKIFPKCIEIAEGRKSKGNTIEYERQDYTEVF